MVVTRLAKSVTVFNRPLVYEKLVVWCQGSTTCEGSSVWPSLSASM